MGTIILDLAKERIRDINNQSIYQHGLVIGAMLYHFLSEDFLSEEGNIYPLTLFLALVGFNIQQQAVAYALRELQSDFYSSEDENEDEQANYNSPTYFGLTTVIRSFFNITDNKISINPNGTWSTIIKTYSDALKNLKHPLLDHAVGPQKRTSSGFRLAAKNNIKSFLCGTPNLLANLSAMTLEQLGSDTNHFIAAERIIRFGIDNIENLQINLACRIGIIHLYTLAKEKGMDRSPPQEQLCAELAYESLYYLVENKDTCSTESTGLKHSLLGYINQYKTPFTDPEKPLVELTKRDLFKSILASLIKTFMPDHNHNIEALSSHFSTETMLNIKNFPSRFDDFLIETDRALTPSMQPPTGTQLQQEITQLKQTIQGLKEAAQQSTQTDPEADKKRGPQNSSFPGRCFF